VYKVPPKDERRQVDPGALIRRFICCLLPLFEQLQKLPQNPTPKQLQDWLVDFIAVVREFLVEEGLYDCEVVRRLNGVVVPVATGTLAQYMAGWTPAFEMVVEIVIAVFQKCLCSALLPPCPPPEMNDCVPIATVTVARGQCRVKHACNIGNRRFLVTWPNVQYWLSWLPILTSWLPGGSTLRGALEALCCTPIAGRFRQMAGADLQMLARRRAVAPGIAVPEATAAADRHPFARMLADSMGGGREVNAATLVLAALGATAKDGTPLVSPVDLEYPGQAMLLHQVIGPTLAPLFTPLGAAGQTGGDTATLERSVAELRQIVKEQQVAIEELRRR
jgi:hypothetical protein